MNFVPDPTVRNDGKHVCTMCFPRAQVFGEVVPGYVLAYVCDPTCGFPAHHWFLFDDFHQPQYWWPEKPEASSYKGRTEEEVNSWAEDDSSESQEVLHMERAGEIEKSFHRSPMEGWSLVEACARGGWEAAEGAVMFWLVDRMARLIDTEVRDAVGSDPVTAGFSGGDLVDL